MITINRKKFLTELSKLLTFMYEEDRQEALALYDQMFDDAVEEQDLLRFLTSPTKQAVVIARSYNAKEQKLAVTSQSGDNAADIAGDKTPAFVDVINDLYADALDRGILTSQFTEDAPEDVGEPDSPEAGAADPEDVTAASPAQPESPAVSEPLLQDDFPDLSLEMPEEVTQFLSGTAEPDTPEATDLPGDGTEESPASGGEDIFFFEEESPADQSGGSGAEDDLSNFSLDLGPVPPAARSNPNEINEAMAAFQMKNGSVPRAAAPRDEQTTLSEFEDSPAEKALPWKREPEEPSPAGKLVVPMVILYLIAAVPLTAVCIAVLLIPTLLSLGISAAAGVYSFRFISLAFGNFAVFADIMAVLGGGLILLAVALLFFWIFLWFVGTAIAGLINAVIRLGGKICYKDGVNTYE